MDERRTLRVAEALREELIELISYELNDPRISILDVTEVRLAPDMRHAVVRVAIEGDAENRTEVVAALEHARGFLRREIAKRLQLFKMPELHFEPDVLLASPERARHLLRRVRRGRPRDSEPADNKNPIE